MQSVTASEVLLDVAGQSLAFPLAAIYFGAPPRTAGGSPLNDALRVLKGLQSATSAAVNYRDYAPRITDAKIQVDQMLGDAPDGPIKTAIAEALGFYVYASNAWIACSNYEAIALNPLFESCEPLKRKIESLDRRGSSGLPAGAPLRVRPPRRQGNASPRDTRILVDLQRAVAFAITTGLLRRDTIPAELLDHLAGPMRFYEEEQATS